MSRFDGFVPGRHLIDALGGGGFRFAEMSHRGSILATPGGVRIWPVAAFADLTLASLQPVLDEAAEIDFLILGIGREIAFLPPALRDPLKAAGIVVEAMATPAAARTYNVLVAEERRVAAALIAID
ncbi:Mth938-like domain-containing protein [Bosea sp. TWI1241]|uniref:Mth938-like domain-containing protein n=1 Tax=Bosea sp. TWI1241 TaxID=3148904 RepID=UPI00320AE402